MKGATIRITDETGKQLTGIVIDVDEPPDTTIGTRTDLVAMATVRHRPQWPSMANQRTIYMDIGYHWYDSQARPITVETIQPAPNPGPQLVKR